MSEFAEFYKANNTNFCGAGATKESFCTSLLCTTRQYLSFLFNRKLPMQKFVGEVYQYSTNSPTPIAIRAKVKGTPIIAPPGYVSVLPFVSSDFYVNRAVPDIKYEEIYQLLQNGPLFLESYFKFILTKISKTTLTIRSQLYGDFTTTLDGDLVLMPVIEAARLKSLNIGDYEKFVEEFDKSIQRTIKKTIFTTDYTGNLMSGPTFQFPMPYAGQILVGTVSVTMV